VLPIQEGQNLAVKLSGEGIVSLFAKEIDLLWLDHLDMKVGLNLEQWGGLHRTNSQ
jgi:hypothetical protein